MNLINFSLRLNGYKIEAAKKKLQELTTQSGEDLEHYFSKRKTEILNYHLENNLFYQNLVNGKPTDWQSLPVLTKSDLQKPLQSRLSNGFSQKNVHIHRTSGSSGHPFIFAKDKFAHALSWASIQRLYASAGIDLKTSYEARFYGIPQSGFAHYKERFKDLLSNRYRFSIFDTSEANFQDFIRRFQSNKFGHLNGYTSSLVLFANYLAEKNLVLKELCPSLTHCIVTAEMLFKDDLNVLKRQFGIPVLLEYGASETGVVAFGKAEENWIIDSSLLYVEILDEKNKPVPEGTIGKIIVTSLFNKAHAFIRYELGDLGCLRTVQGRLVLTKLEGRIGDFAILPDGKKVPALTFYYVTKEIINDSGNVKEFTIIQNDASTFSINYVADFEFSEVEKQKILAAIKNYLNGSLEIHFHRKETLNRSNRGKLRQFTREF